jgi:glycosyltransferase involved in cell wall biosynthesis
MESERGSMCDSPTVSVVIPLYNKGKYIGRALSSVLAQTVRPIEIIVVDDGSTDDGPERVRRCKDPRIVLLRQENKGPGAARNTGLAKARCRYISFLDADDEWYPSFLDAALSLLESDSANATVVCTGFSRYPDRKENSEKMRYLSRCVHEVNEGTNVGLVRELVAFSTVCFAVMRTETVRRWGGFFDRNRCVRGEDSYLFYKLIFNERIGIIPEPHGIYHTEASDLYGGGSKNLFAIAPFLKDPGEIIASCPSSKRHILREILAIRALADAESLAKCGRGREAEDLLNSFVKNYCGSPKGVFRTRLLIRLAPAMPAVRWVWRQTRLLMNRSGSLVKKFSTAFLLVMISVYF